MVPGEGGSLPHVGVVVGLGPNDDGGVADVTDVNFAPADESDTGGCARSGGESVAGLGPLRHFPPHGQVSLDEALVNGAKDLTIVVNGPEALQRKINEIHSAWEIRVTAILLD